MPATDWRSSGHANFTDFLNCTVCRNRYNDSNHGDDFIAEYEAEYNYEPPPIRYLDSSEPVQAEPYQEMAELHGYSYRPDWQFMGSGAPWYGMEIEIEGSTPQLLRCVQRYLGDIAICKEDGSVNGIEIVTHPMSYAWASEYFPWDEFFTSLREDYGGRTRNQQNGIHVHISRDSFGREPGNIDSPGRESHLYRWMKFIYRNQEMVETIARRSDSTWAEFTRTHRTAQLTHATKGKLPKRANRQPSHGILAYVGYNSSYYVADIGNPDDMYARSIPYSTFSRLYPTDGYGRPRTRPEYAEYAGRYYPILNYLSTVEYDRVRDDEYYGRIGNRDDTQSSRYSAINTQNTDTLEVRVFASTTYPERAQAALELCAASVEYTRSLTADAILHRDGWTWPSFIAYAREHEYEALTNQQDSIRNGHTRRA